MKLSIIIPIYKVESSIDRCLNSVVCQDYCPLEIILVDDGSPDRCPEICDKWAEKDKRIIVIHKENGGLSDARNAGIDIATGEYITFIDSDDYIDTGLITSVMNVIANNPQIDILEYSFKIKGKNKDELCTFNERIFNDRKEYWTLGKAYKHSYAWNKIYKRDLFDNIRFPKGKVFEDMWTLPSLTGKAQTIATTSIGNYNYCWSENGITANAKGHELKMLLEAHINLIEDKGLDMLNDTSYYMHVINIQLDVYEMTNNKPILGNHKIKNIGELPFKQRIKAIVYNTLGINNLCIINKLIHEFIKCH